MALGTQHLAYRAASTLRIDELSLQTAGGRVADRTVQHPRFFAGALKAARPCAVGLTVLADLAAADFRRGRDGSVARATSRDPIVTCGGRQLRFEALSACCGGYARLDVLPAALDGDTYAHGTTNVDVNAPLYTALSRVGAGAALRLSVGPDDLTVTTPDGALVEKRVPLPERWLRGLAEAAAIGAGLDLRAELDGSAAGSVIHRLPAHGGRDIRWLVPAGRSVRATRDPVPGAVCLPGAYRLAVLRPLLPLARTVRLYGPPVGTGSGPVVSGWELDLGQVRFSMLLSPGVHRGLSGEGRLLDALAGDAAAGDAAAEDAELIAPRLGWDGTIDPAALADSAGLTGARVRGALAALSVSGRVGFDWAEAAYFHRELPYRPELVAALNPRMGAARALVADGGVRPVADGVEVSSGQRTYLVHRVASGHGCTCPWWIEHRGGRGPCKHVLAATLADVSGPAVSR